MRNFAGLLNAVACTVNQVARNIHVHVISFTKFEFYCSFFKLLSAVDQ